MTVGKKEDFPWHPTIPPGESQEFRFMWDEARLIEKIFVHFPDGNNYNLRLTVYDAPTSEAKETDRQQLIPRQTIAARYQEYNVTTATLATLQSNERLGDYVVGNDVAKLFAVGHVINTGRVLVIKVNNTDYTSPLDLDMHIWLEVAE